MYKYLHHQPMTSEELEEFVQRIRDGDDDALKFLVSNNIKVMIKFLRDKHVFSYDKLHDIMPMMIESISKYDPSKGSISHWIYCSVSMALKCEYNKTTPRKRDESGRVYVDNIDHIGDDESKNPRQSASVDEDKWMMNYALNEAIDSLTDMEDKIIMKYYFKDMILEDIAREEGISYARVWQIHKAALKKMRPYIEEYIDDLR